MTIELTKSEATVFYKMLFRWNQSDHISLDSPEEQQLLWDLECVLEKKLEPIEW